MDPERKKTQAFLPSLLTQLGTGERGSAFYHQLFFIPPSITWTLTYTMKEKNDKFEEKYLTFSCVHTYLLINRSCQARFSSMHMYALHILHTSYM